MSNLDEPNMSPTIYTSLNGLVMNGIQIDKNLRQPTYYSTVNSNELKSEVFGIISDLLTNQKVPMWLGQRIALFYADKYLNEIINDLTDLNNTSNEIDTIDYVDSTEPKTYIREEIVVYLRNSISKIIKDWQIKKSSQIKPNLLFSFARFEQEISNNLKYSEFGIKNKRRIMEDKIAIIENIELFQRSFGMPSIEPDCKRASSLFGVFDGHCGVDCAQYISKHLPMYLIQHADFYGKNKDINKALIDSFQTINQRFTQKARKESLKSGSTCCLAVLSAHSDSTNKPSSLDVAWCGDSRLGLVKNGKFEFLTKEHKPDDADEKKRIIDAGGNVAFVSNAWRVDSSLAVSRSFGDIVYQPSIISDPELKHFDLDGDEDYLVIGCDGLWEALDQNEICSIIYEQASEESIDTNKNIAEILVRKAQSNGSMDNITAIFVLLKESLNQIANPNSETR